MSNETPHLQMAAIEIIETQDGSHSLFSAEFGVSYHSRYGAIQESKHVYIEAGLYPLLLRKKQLDILEMGFGSGLNALLTLLETQRHGFVVTRYEAVDAFPLPLAQASELNYPQLLKLDEPLTQAFHLMHQAPWEQPVAITSHFQLFKKESRFEALHYEQAFDLIYYDAFAPTAQPELWTADVLSLMYRALRPGGIWVTYCAKGEVKRHLKSLGFVVESLPGPPGKREMIRAIRP